MIVIHPNNADMCAALRAHVNARRHAPAAGDWLQQQKRMHTTRLLQSRCALGLTLVRHKERQTLRVVHLFAPETDAIMENA